MAKFIFLDRDGVICEEREFLHKKEDLKLIEGSAGAIRLLNEENFKVIIITNQSVIAIGLCNEQEVIEIDLCLKELLEKEGAIIEKTYYCPHHPIIGDNLKYTRECYCRKPLPGMILQAKKDFDIEDISEAYMIGDKIGDILAGKRAGCKTILVKTGYGGKEGFSDATPDYVAKNLNEAVEKIILKK